MDAATLYMIVTMHNGAFKTGHVEVPSMQECLAQVDDRNSGANAMSGGVAWCRPANKRIVIAR